MRSKLNLDQHFNPIITIRDAKYTLSKLHKVWGDKMQKKKEKNSQLFHQLFNQKKNLSIALKCSRKRSGFCHDISVVLLMLEFRC